MIVINSITLMAITQQYGDNIVKLDSKIRAKFRKKISALNWKFNKLFHLKIQLYLKDKVIRSLFDLKPKKCIAYCKL